MWSASPAIISGYPKPPANTYVAPPPPDPLEPLERPTWPTMMTTCEPPWREMLPDRAAARPPFPPPLAPAMLKLQACQEIVFCDVCHQDTVLGEREIMSGIL